MPSFPGISIEALADRLVETGIIPVAFSTDEIDFTLTAGQIIPFVGSVFPGYFFMTPVSANFVRSRLTAKAGTLTTRPQHVWGNNTGGVNNYLSAASDTIADAQFTAGVGAFSSAGGVDTAVVPLDMSNGLAIKTTRAGSGVGTTCKGKIYICGYLAPL